MRSFLAQSRASEGSPAFVAVDSLLGRFLSVSSRPAPLAGRDIEGSYTHASKTWSSVCESFTAPSGMAQCLLRRWPCGSRVRAQAPATGTAEGRVPQTRQPTRRQYGTSDFTQVSQRTSFLQCVHDASQVVGAVHARVLFGGVSRVSRTYAGQA